MDAERLASLKWDARGVKTFFWPAFIRSDRRDLEFQIRPKKILQRLDPEESCTVAASKDAVTRNEPDHSAMRTHGNNNHLRFLFYLEPTERGIC
jgi:hypothetical protein